jgi:hypothetical protein
VSLVNPNDAPPGFVAEPPTSLTFRFCEECHFEFVGDCPKKTNNKLYCLGRNRYDKQEVIFKKGG